MSFNGNINVCHIIVCCSMQWDYSGLAAIGKVIGVIALSIGVMWLCTQPILLVIVIAILIIIAVNGSSLK